MARSTIQQTPLLTSTDNESLTEYVGSRGIMKSCDIFSLTPFSSIKRLINYPSFSIKHATSTPLIYICSSAIPNFITEVLPHIKYSFILVSGDCDETIPDNIFSTITKFEEFINDPRIQHWYCQNWIGTHSKVTQIPIGLDYHTMANRAIYWGPMTSPLNQEALLKKIKTSAKKFWERLPQCYGNFQFLMTTKYGSDRIDAFSSIPKELAFYEEKQNMRAINWFNQSKYAFVISPHGNGLDCHRTWEALVLGCIPIVKTSPLDPLYDGLPVLIVKEWKDVSETLLNATITQFKESHMAGMYKYDKLTLKYWNDIIHSNT